MVHGRMIRPPVAGAVPVKVDESSIKDIPGAKVVWDKGFLGVVADKEWDAIKAAQQLKVEWSDAKPPFPNMAALYDHIRKAPVRKREVEGKTAGNVDEAFKTAARVIEAEYEWPFQSHACMGPACAAGRDQGRQRHLLDRLAEAAFRAATASPRIARHAAREGARASGCPAPAPTAATTPATPRWTPRCWRRRSASRCGVQYMRDQGTGWDPKGPASIHRARAAIDASGKVIAYEFISKGFSRVDVNTNESKPLRHAGRPAHAACR